MHVHLQNDASADGFAKHMAIAGNGEWETSDR